MMTFPWDKTLSIPVADIGLCMFERYEDARYHRFHPVYFEAGARNPAGRGRCNSDPGAPFLIHHGSTTNAGLKDRMDEPHV